MNQVLPDTVPYPDLFKRFELAGRPLKNRIVHAAILTALADKGRVTDRLINYYANRAKGGAAMVVTEPVGALTRHQASARGLGNTTLLHLPGDGARCRESLWGFPCPAKRC